MKHYQLWRFVSFSWGAVLETDPPSKRVLFKKKKANIMRKKIRRGKKCFYHIVLRAINTSKDVPINIVLLGAVRDENKREKKIIFSK
jgi:hypothetical protein